MVRRLAACPMMGPVVPEGLDSVTCTVAPTVGQKPARAWSASAAAMRTCASAAATVWFAVSTRAISASSFGSVYIAHQLPRGAKSFGSACFHCRLSR